MIRRILAASLLVLGGSAVAAAQTPVVMMPMALPGATGELAQRLLAAQNRERIAVGHAPLQWDPALAASAATYGPTLASLRRLVHSPRETRPGQRENLAMAFHGTLSPEQMVDM